MNPGREKFVLSLCLFLLVAASANAQSNVNFSINIGSAGNQITVTWDQTSGVLEQADAPAGPWTEVREALSPYHFSPDNQPKFFRLSLSSGGTVQGFLYSVNPEQKGVVLPGVSVYLSNVATGQQSPRVTTDRRGGFLISPAPPGHYQLCWEGPGYVSDCSTQQVVVAGRPIALLAEAVQLRSDSSNAVLFGQVRFPDNSPTQRRDPALAIDFQTTIRLETTNGVTVSSNIVNAMGEYVLAGVPPGIPLQLIATCEGATSQSNITLLPPSGLIDLAFSNRSPVIDDLVVTLNGQPIRRPPPGATVQLTATVHDPDNDALHFLWVPGLNAGSFVSSDATNVEWTLPDSAGEQVMYLRVNDGHGGYSTDSLRLSTDPQLLFTGQALDSDGQPVPNATVTVGNATTTTDAGGAFALTVTNDAPPFILTIQKPGLPSISRVFNDESAGGNYTFYKPEVFTGSADTDISIVAGNGTEILIPSNSLVRVDGLPIVNPVKVLIATPNLCNPQQELPVSNLAPDPLTGATNFLESLSTAHVEFRDAASNALTFAIGSDPTIGLAISPACSSATPPTRGIWAYNLAAGAWTQTGIATLKANPGGPPVYVAPLAFLNFPGYVAVDPVVTNAIIKINVDRTINLPITLTIYTPGYFNRSTIFSTPFYVGVPAQHLVIYSVASPNESPGVFQTPGGSILPEGFKAPIWQQQHFSPGAGVLTNLNISLGDYIPYLGTNVETFAPFLTWASPNASASNAARYYSAIDPLNKKDTLTKWKIENGFNPTNDSADDAKAFYFNATDLGFGRAMHMKIQLAADGKTNVAFYVSNHPTADHAYQGLGLSATVCMDSVYDPNFPPPSRYVKFYVFDASGQRSLKADLDHHGDKFVPDLCVVCHGKNGYTEAFYKGTNIAATFLPFDINSFTFGQSLAIYPGAQDAEFKKMNLAITNSLYETPATRDLVTNWYRLSTFDRGYIPSVWPTIWTAPTNATVYRDTLRVSCRSCHAARLPDLQFNNDYGLDFATPDNLKLTYDASLWVGQYLQMPNSQRNWTTFWGSKTANMMYTNITPNEPEILRARYIGKNPNWNGLP